MEVNPFVSHTQRECLVINIPQDITCRSHQHWLSPKILICLHFRFAVWDISVFIDSLSWTRNTCWNLDISHDFSVFSHSFAGSWDFRLMGIFVCPFSSPFYPVEFYYRIRWVPESEWTNVLSLDLSVKRRINVKRMTFKLGEKRTSI